MPTTYLESFGADLSENELFQCVSILLTGTSTILATANLARTYADLGKYSEAEKLEEQVLGARNRLLGGGHPDTINAMESLAMTFRHPENHTEAQRFIV